MLLFAHRGASADAPENTMSAFREAIRQGADGIELDVMRCGSGEVVVCHDDRLDRLAGLPWPVAETSWAQLRTADVGSGLGFGVERIPLLEEVLEALPDGFWLNVELKCDRVFDRGLTSSVRRALAAHRGRLRFVVSSFNPYRLLQLRLRAGELLGGYLVDPDKSFALHGRVLARFLARGSVHPHQQDCTPERVARWHARGLRVAVWTVDDAAQAHDLQAMGVDILITNCPGKLRVALGAAVPRSPGRPSSSAS